MLKDNINNFAKYENLNKNIRTGLEYLFNSDFSKINDGKYNINEKMYVNIQSYQTKSSAYYEAHRKYIDIQYIIDGEEYIGVTSLSDCTCIVDYDTEKDIEFLDGKNNYIKLSKEEFMILYPTDAHKPSISIDASQPQNVRKAVIKIQIT